MNTLKAKLPKEPIENGRNLGGDKELIESLVLIGCKRGKMRELATFRAYAGRSRSASVIYGSIWIHVPSKTSDYASYGIAGHGQAGGYGYHKVSAAMQSALTSAKVELYGNVYSGPGHVVDFKKRAFIDGVGSSAMDDAMRAIGRALGYSNMMLVRG